MIDIQLSDFLLLHGCKAALSAGDKIMEIYSKDNFNVTLKSDSSPITEADTLSHNCIKDILTATRIPLLSEEGRNMLFEERYNWDYYWLVDPLDGTHEFVQKNGEFIVSIALMHDNKPELGIIYVPASGKLYFSSDSHGAFRMENCPENFMEAEDVQDFIAVSEKIEPIKRDTSHVRLVITRSHMTPETTVKVEQIKKQLGDIEVINRGSGLKFCMLADGDADLYLRTTDLSDWDIAAGHAIMNSLGYEMKHLDGEEIKYNKNELRIAPFYVNTLLG